MSVVGIFGRYCQSRLFVFSRMSDQYPVIHAPFSMCIRLYACGRYVVQHHRLNECITKNNKIKLKKNVFQIRPTRCLFHKLLVVLKFIPLCPSGNLISCISPYIYHYYDSFVNCVPIVRWIFSMGQSKCNNCWWHMNYRWLTAFFFEITLIFEIRAN